MDGEQPAPYPPEDGSKLRRIPFPVAAPERKPREPKPKPRRSGDPNCPRCKQRRTGDDDTREPGQACPDHADFSYDPLAALGIRPPARRSPDEYVHDWRPV